MEMEAEAGGPLFRCPHCDTSTASANGVHTVGSSCSTSSSSISVLKSSTAAPRFSSMTELKRHLAMAHKIGADGLSVSDDSQFSPDNTGSASTPSVEAMFVEETMLTGTDSGRASQTSQHNFSTLDGLVERAQSLDDHLRRTHASASLVDRCRESSESAVKRLSAELLRSKQQYWSAVDSMQKAHDDVRSMRHSLVRGEVAGVDMELVSQCSKLSEQLLAVKAGERRKEASLEAVQGRCQSLSLECSRLQRAADELAKQADTNAEAVAVLKGEIAEKDRCADQLNTFLTMQAKRQEVARDELRSYIASLERQVVAMEPTSPSGRVASPGSKGSSKLETSFIIEADLPDELAAVFRRTPASTAPADGASDDNDDSSNSGSDEGDATLLEPESKLPTATLSDSDKTWLAVFHYLDTVDLFRIGAVCKQWRALSRFPRLWRNVALDRPRMPGKVLIRMAQWCKEVHSIRLDGICSRKVRRDESVLEYVNSLKGSMEDDLMPLLKANSKSVKRLGIVDCGIVFTQRVLWVASVSCPNLVEFCYVSEEFPASPGSVWSLAQGCRHITRLRIPPVHLSERAKDFTDTCLKNIASGWPQLTHLAIGGPSLSLDGFVLIASGCPRLEFLELDRCAAINDTVGKVLCKRGLRGLRALELFLTRISVDAVVTFVGACPRLESVSVHIGISDYFSDPSDPLSVSSFNAAMQELKDLASNKPYDKILKINASYG